MRILRTLDWQIITPTIFLIVLGLITLLSASMPYAEKMWHNPYHFFTKQLISLVLASLCACFCFYIRPIWWQRWRYGLIFLSFILLLAVFVPGIGVTVKGSSRWLSLGFMNLQVSECVKLAVFIYMAGFIDQHHDDLRWSFKGFIKPLIVLSLISSLIILEPDFGAVCVILFVALCQMYVCGSRLRYMVFLALGVMIVLAVVLWMAPYRLERLTAFWDPWLVADKKGYQVIHAMMAVKSGGLLGVGLGESIEKWFYLPEAHNDFLLAILIEECGILALVGVMLGYGLIFSRMLQLAMSFIHRKDWFTGSLVYGIAMWWSIQALINIGVNIGMLPTKGITLPLMSYGGSSLMAFAASLGIVLRIAMQHEEVK